VQVAEDAGVDLLAGRAVAAREGATGARASGDQGDGITAGLAIPLEVAVGIDLEEIGAAEVRVVLGDHLSLAARRARQGSGCGEHESRCQCEALHHVPIASHRSSVVVRSAVTGFTAVTPTNWPLR